MCLQCQRLFGMFLQGVLRTNQGWWWMGPSQTLWGLRTSQHIPQDQGSAAVKGILLFMLAVWRLSLGEGSPAKTLPLNWAKLPGAGMVSWMISPEGTAEKWSLPDTGGRVLSFTQGRSKGAHSFWDAISTPCRYSHYNFLKVISDFHLIWWVKFNHKQSSSTRSKCHFRTTSQIQIFFFFSVPMPGEGLNSDTEPQFPMERQSSGLKCNSPALPFSLG